MRRLALEALETRALMAVLPAPVPDPQLPFDAAGFNTNRKISSDGPNNPGNDQSPQIAVDRYNPDKLVAVWVDHDVLGNPEPEYTVKGKFSTDAGLTWSPLTGLPPVQFDPSSGSNPHPFDMVRAPSVAFDGQDNFYVLEIQSSADKVTAGTVLLQGYSFANQTPAAKGPATTLISWNRSASPVPIVKAIRDAQLAVDDNLPSFTDPTTGLVQTDIGANHLYVAWQTDVPIPNGYSGPWNLNTTELVTSVNGGASFGAPVTAGAGHFQNVEVDASPRLTISQGRAPKTNSPTDPGTPGGQVTVLFDDINSARTANPPQDIIWATPFTATSAGATSLGQQFVTSTIALGNVDGLGGSIASAATTIGIGPGAVIASDNTLGSFHANQGRLYVAYTDRYDPIRFGAPAANNPADNTDVFLMTSDDGGFTWSGPSQVNDDSALHDGFSAATSPADPEFQIYNTGRPQFQPALAVDPVTGTLVISYEDTRFDPAKARTVSTIQLSSDGGATYSPSTQADINLQAYDQTLNRDLSLGPIPSNGSARTNTQGLGDRMGLATYNGRLYDAYVSNVNGGDGTNAFPFAVYVAPMLYATGPRVVSSTMGQAQSQTVTPLDPNQPPITFNNQFLTDGTPVLDGFVVTFDRPIDAATFTRSDVTVTYRDPFTSGSLPGIPVPVTQDPIPLNDGTTQANAGGTTKFLVRFAAQSNVGTYSYTVGPNIRDLYRNTLATNIYYADQSPANLPTLPPVGTGGTGVPAQDNATSKLVIAGVPANQGILDLDVLLTLNHTSDSDLVIKLIPPTGYLPAGQFILLTQNHGGTGANFVDTTFDDQARTAITAGAAPYSGHFRPDPTSANLLRSVNGKSPNGTWTLEIDDTRTGNVGKLVSWGLKVTTSNRSFDGKFTQAGVAAQTGSLMDQNGDGLGGQNPNTGGVSPAGSEIFGTAPGDVYAVPTPKPAQPEIFNGQNVNPPYDPTTLPLMISGAHVVRSFVPGAARPTLDNLVTDQAVNGFDIVFDRDMDPNTITVGNHIARIATPYGTFAPGQLLPDGSTLVLQIKADPNSDPNNPGSDPDTTHPRTYQVQFFKIPAGGTNPVPFPQTQSGTYSVTFTSDIQDKNGDPVDANQNAGLDFLRGTASAGTLPQNYASQAPVTIGPGLANESDIVVPDSFLVKNVIVGLNITYPQDAKLTATLISPDGFSVLLFSNVLNGKNFTNTFLSDAADTPIQNGGPPFFGTFNPQQPLSQFVDHFSAGTWRLRIDVPAGAPSGTIVNWSLKLAQPLSNSGLGEPVADQFTQSFRIFAFDPTNPLAANTWTAVGPNGEGAKQQGGNAEVSGRVSAIAVDPSDASGNTVYVGGASGGIWKTTNFLTKDPTGPIYTPLIDDATISGMNISSIAIFPRNNDPAQSIIYAGTGDPDAGGDPNVRGAYGTLAGVGILRSMDGGATWDLLDSTDNTSIASRDHIFNGFGLGFPGQLGGTTVYKVVVDPKPTPDGQVIVYAAMTQVFGASTLSPAPGTVSGTLGGIWKSLDSGRTWKQMRAGQATDITLDYNSVNKDSGNLDFLYAAFRNEGVFFSPNAAQNFDLMTGDVGDPLIQDVDFPQPLPVNVNRVVPITTPNAKSGRIVLAKPARKVNPDGTDADPLFNLITQGWLYAAVVNFVPPGTDPVETPLGSTFVNLYMTKDFGQTWTPVAIPALTANGAPELPTNDTRNNTLQISGSGTPLGAPFALGDFDLSLAVDPNNPNVVLLGGTSEYRATGLVRVDTTGIHDSHAFYTDSNNVSGSLRTTATDGAVSEISPNRGVPFLIPPYEPVATPFLNLIRDPANPFQNDATILVQNTSTFNNDGGHTKWTRFDQAVAPDPFADPLTDPWSVPTRNVHQIIPIQDPLTGQSRFLFGTDQGVYTAVSDQNGQLIGSIGSQTSLATNQGDVQVVNGSRNGNLAIAQVQRGAAQPSQLAAQLANLKGFFFTASQDSGLGQSDPDIINASKDAQGNPLPGYGNLSYNVDTINGPSNFVVGAGGTVDRGNFTSVATQQNVANLSGGGQQGGNIYSFRTSEDLVGLDNRPSTDTVQVNDIGRTFRLYQTDQKGNTPDPQWPFRAGSLPSSALGVGGVNDPAIGFNVVVNPLSADQMIVGSQAGRVFATTTQGRIWSEIGNPSALNGQPIQSLAYGAPDPAPPGGGLGTLNNYIFVGTQERPLPAGVVGPLGAQIFVTFTGGGGTGNAWKDLSAGLDGSTVQAIITNPNRGSHEAYAVTRQGVYHMADALAGGSWVNVTGNLFQVLHDQFNNPSLGTEKIAKVLTSIQADWRYLIPNDFNNPSAGTHPMLYVGAVGGVFRSLDGGATWGLFPDGATAAGAFNPNGLLYSPAGQGGGLPDTQVTDLDLSLGNIDPTTGRPNVATGPNVLMASTYGRGAFAIRLAPIVFTNTASNTTILTLSPTAPVPPGTSDSGFSDTDYVTNVTRPVVEGLSEQSAFGNSVTIDLYDVTSLSQDQIQSLLLGTSTLASLGIKSIGTGTTDAAGNFAVQVNAGVYASDGSTDGAKKILVQATNGSGTKGNLAPLGLLNFADPNSYSFILDTTAPLAPGTPDLTPASDAGLSNSDDITNVTTAVSFNVALSTGEPATTYVYLVRDTDTNIVAQATGTAAPGTITLTDPGPVPEGDHFYYAYEVDLAGNKGPISGKLKVHFDTTAPAKPSQPILDLTNPAPNGSDSGVVGDNITNVKRPFLTGSAEAGGLIQIIDAAGNVLGPASFTVNVSPNGHYSVSPAADLADGTYALRVREEDVAGNLSQPSAPLTVKIQSRIPGNPTLSLVPADDTGVVGDNITSNTQPRLAGTAEPGLAVQLILDSGTIPGVAPGGVIAPTAGQQPILVASDGTYLVRFPAKLADGTYVVHTVVSDVAGNSSQSNKLTLTILSGGGTGGGSPAAPTLALNPADDTGIKGDNVTVVRRPRFIGTATFNDGSIAAGVPIDLVTTSGLVLSTTTTSTTGTFTLGLPNDLSDGTISVLARLRDVAGNAGPPSNVVTLKITSVPGDFNGDGKSDLVSFSRATSTFTISSAAAAGTPGSGTLAVTAPFLTQPGDIPVQGDFDGDGKMDYGFYRPSGIDATGKSTGVGLWYLMESRNGMVVVTYGLPNDDLPIPADYDGDGTTDFAVFRQSTAQWIIFQSHTGTIRTVGFGVPGLDRPEPADYTGDGVADFVVYRPSTGQWLAALTPGANNGFNAPNPASPDPTLRLYNAQYGLPNVDVPVPADYNGDGKADIAVYRPTTGQWFFDSSINGAVSSINFGDPKSGDIPVPADYDGDGIADLTVFRPTSAAWLVLGTASQGRVVVSGSPKDVPVLATLQPYRVQNSVTVQTRSLAGSAGADFSVNPLGSGGADLGRTAANFSANSGGSVKSSAPAATTPAAPTGPSRQRPKQAATEHKPAASHKKADGHHHDAALARLGHFKIVRRPR